MTIDEAIKITDPATRQEALYKYDPEERDSVENEARHMAAQALREKHAGGWISVDERSPEEGQLILVYYNGEVRKCQYQGRTHELDPWYDVSENVWFADIIVTHWQPLPGPPPKGE